MKINNAIKVMEDLLLMKLKMKKQYGLTGPSIFILISIGIKKFKTIKEIVEYNKIKKNLDEKEITILKVKITTSIKELVNKNFIIKESSFNDKRIQEIQLTEKAKKLLSQISEINYG